MQSAAASSLVSTRSAATPWREFLCAIWGHAVDNHVFQSATRHCVRRGIPCLEDDGATVRVGHTLSCFLRHHTYAPVGQRDGHMEYGCVQCGHPLLFRLGADPYAGRAAFVKRVRYLCGLFGHRVHRVTERAGGTEYACDCGHSFVQHPAGESVVRHPLVCFLFGHRIEYVESRHRHSEYACRNCGHPFLFSKAESARVVPALVSSRASNQEGSRAG